MQTTVTVHFDCPAASDLAQDRLWWEIYREAFPSSEREPAEVILDSLRKGVGLAFRVLRDGETTGLATTHLLLNPPAVFLVYIAMARSHRGQGQGSALFEHVSVLSTASLRQRGVESLGLIWEVAPPALAADLPEKVVRERRIAFFRRHGGVVLQRRYSQPPLDGIVPVEMQLMFRAAGGIPIPDPATVESLVRAIYYEKYAAINGIRTETLQDLLS